VTAALVRVAARTTHTSLSLWSMVKGGGGSPIGAAAYGGGGGDPIGGAEEVGGGLLGQRPEGYDSP
jgi:hypothetical protein